MAQVQDLATAKLNFLASAGNSCMPPNSVCPIRAPESGLKLAHRCHEICVNFSLTSPLPLGAASMSFPNFSSYASLLTRCKLTLWSQAPYTFSS